MRELTYRQALAAALGQAMREDERIVLLGEDIGAYGGGFGVTKGFLEEFGPERVMDMPIAEDGFTAMAVGMAAAGLRPVVEYMFADFALTAMDAIVNQAAKMHFMTGGQVRVPLVIRGACGCGTGAAAQHSQSLEALFAHAGGICVAMPATPADAAGLLLTALQGEEPWMFLEHKLLYDTVGLVPGQIVPLKPGVAEIRRHGRDISLISYSKSALDCLAAAELLARRGMEAEVIDLRTVNPLDRAAITATVQRTGRALIVHEARQKFGVGAEICAAINESDAFYALKAPVARMGGADMPVPFAKGAERAWAPQPEAIAQRAEQMICGQGKAAILL